MGAEILGSKTIIGLSLGGTFATAVTCASGDALEVDTLTHGEGAEELTTTPIGSGDIGPSETQRGATSPTVSFEAPYTFEGPGNKPMIQFFGAESVMNMGSGAYTHSVYVNEAFNSKWVTAAFQAFSASAGTFEYPSCTVTRLGWTLENPPNFVTQAVDMLGDQQKISGQSNTYTVLEAAVSTTSPTRVVLESTDELLINTQSGGALATPTDRINFTSATIEFEKPQEHVREVKGSAGNGQPISSGNPPLMWTLSITMPRYDAHTWFTAAQAGTEYKASITITGPLIGGSQYKKIIWNFPRLKIVADPEYNLTQAGNNPATVVFKGLVAASNPTGMIDRYPYMLLTNTKSTAWTA